MFICDFIACHPSVPQHAVTKICLHESLAIAHSDRFRAIYVFVFLFLDEGDKKRWSVLGSGLWLMIEPAQVTAALRSTTGTTKQAFTEY